MAKIKIWHCNTTDWSYRDWQLVPWGLNFICIRCHRLLRKRYCSQVICNKCRAKHDQEVGYNRRLDTMNKRRDRMGCGRQHWKTLCKRVHERDKYCQMCGSTEKLTVDHIVPICFGGQTDLPNLQLLCKKCHNLKSACEILWQKEYGKRQDNSAKNPISEFVQK